MGKSVFAILVNYKHPEVTIEGVKSLKNSNYQNLTVIVVDNGSPDDSYGLLKNLLPADVILLRSLVNMGFAAGNNIGIEYALNHQADYIMLLNNDTKVDPNMIQYLIQHTNDITVTAPKMYYYDNPTRIWFAGGKYDKLSGRFKHIGENKQDAPEFHSVLECDFLTGCCIFMTSNVVHEVGLLDESYFMYIEDVDYSLRLRKKGIQLMMIPEAKLWHKIGISSGGVESKFNIYYGNRNRLYLQKKFGFNHYTRLVTFASRIVLMLKGVVLNTNQKYIWYSIVDYYANRMGKQERRV